MRIDIAIPVYYGNIPIIEDSLKKQIDFYKKNIKDDWKIVLAFNGLDKGVIKFAEEMKSKYENVDYTYTEIVGKGAGIKNAWKKSDAEIVSYMDVDLSTGIEAFPELINAVKEEYDEAIGSKYLKNSEIKRVKERYMISKIYHKIIAPLLLGIKTSDIHCGFKAYKKSSYDQIEKHLKDNEWFFDTELMFFSTRKKFKIKEVPVIWTDSGLPSGVNMKKTIPKFIFKMIVLRLKYLFKRV